jgi:hypothetical protein
MPIQVVSAVTTSGIANQIIDYCNIPNPVLAIGAGWAWPAPDLPPLPSIFLTNLPNQLGYVPITRRVPVIQKGDGDIAVSLDEAWQTLPLDADAIQQQNCHHVLIEARIFHNTLPSSITSYRAAGLYLRTTLTGLTTFATTPEVDGYLDLIQQFGVIEVAENAIHVLRIIRQF